MIPSLSFFFMATLKPGTDLSKFKHTNFVRVQMLGQYVPNVFVRIKFLGRKQHTCETCRSRGCAQRNLCAQSARGNVIYTGKSDNYSNKIFVFALVSECFKLKSSKRLHTLLLLSFLLV